MSQSLEDATRLASAIDADADARPAAPFRRPRRGRHLVATALVFLVALIAAPGAARAQVSAGALRVSVKDRDFEVPLGGARVAIVEALLSLETTDEGTIVFPAVPPGAYTVTVSKPGYQRIVKTGVVVTPDRLAEIEVELVAEVIELEELVVTGFDPLASSELGLLEIRATALQVQDAISSELISRAGASDVAGALKLVVGTSIVDGKYATVRGLSDRYTGTTLNGVRVPSADPRRRAVQVDLFPAGTLDSVTVNKTFTPDLQGDFTGGGVDIRTKSVPEERVLSLSVSTEYDENATDNPDFLTYVGGGVDRKGFSTDDSREHPDVDPATLPNPGANTGTRPSPQQILDAQIIDRATRAFVPVIGTSRESAEWNHGFSFTGGNKYRTEKGRVFGFLGSLTYSHSYDFFDGGFNNKVAKGESDPVRAEIREDSQGSDELLIGLLGSAEFRPVENHGFSLKVVANQASEDKARFQLNRQGQNGPQIGQTLRYTERTVVSVQLHGDHAFEDLFSFGKGSQTLEANWVASANYTRQDEPDVRFFVYDFDPNTGNGTRPTGVSEGGSRRIFINIEERNEQFSGNAKLKFRQWGGLESEVKFGVYGEQAERVYDQVSYVYDFQTSPNPRRNPVSQLNNSFAGFTALYPGQIWTDVFFDDRRIGLSPNQCTGTQNPFTSPCVYPHQLIWYLKTTGQDVSYTAEQEITAAYAMATLPITERLKAVVGARLETTDIFIAPFDTLDPTDDLFFIVFDEVNGNRAQVELPPSELISEISDEAWLPAVSAIYELRPQMNLRASWSQTIARPTFRELAPVATDDAAFGDRFFGNTELEISDIDNYDLRWEWFPRPGNVLAASLFYKDITNPIEYTAFSLGSDPFIQPTNFDKGRLQGVEIEARSGLDVIWKKLEKFVGSVNFTVLDSEVEVPVVEQVSLAPYDLDEDKRRLLGQPEYIANASLTYDDEDRGTSAGLFFNVIGETVLSGAARGATEGVPDVIESSFANLDFTFQQKLKKGLSVSFRARGLLARDRRTVGRDPQENEVIKTLRETARRYSVSMSYKW